MLILFLALGVAEWVGETFEPHCANASDADILRRLGNIVFIGDSTSRYMYLTAAYFVSHGRFPNRTERPSLSRERTWPSWRDFYLGTNAQMANEKCDCYRANIGYDKRAIYENRYLCASSNLTYLQLSGLRPMTLHASVGCHSNATWPEPWVGTRPLLSAMPTKMLPHVAPHLGRVDVVVVNSGFHDQLWKSENVPYFRSLVAGVEAAFPGAKFVWRMTYAGADLAARNALPSTWYVYNVTGMLRPARAGAMWDSFHMIEFANEAFVRMLFEWIVSGCAQPWIKL